MYTLRKQLFSYLSTMNRRKALYLLLIATCCLLGSMPLHWLLTQKARAEMRGRMRAGVDASMLQRFEFDIEDGQVVDRTFALCDEGKEFRLHGQFFDIYRVQDLPGKRIIWALADAQEDALLAQLQARNGPESPLQRAAKSLVKFLSHSLPAPTMKFAAASSSFLSTREMPQFLIPQFDCTVHSPPPQA
jgi:hypothetical protein